MDLFKATNDQPRRVALYMRVSTDEQQRDGYGLESQKRLLLEYVNTNRSMNLQTKDEWIFTDVHTGSVLEERAGIRALKELMSQKKIDAVLIWKIDRLSRSLKHLLTLFEEMQKYDVSLISIQENIDFKGPIGNLIFQIFGAIAQFERELIKGRTTSGKRASADLGNFIGTTIPYGYKSVPSPKGKGKILELYPDEKKWVERIYDWYIYEEMGSGQIAKKLNELGVPKGKDSQGHHRSSKWSDENVLQILTNSLYRGEYVAWQRDEQGKLLPEEEWVVRAYPSCVSEVIWNLAQKVRETRVAGNRKQEDYLLTGKLVDVSLREPKRFYGARRSSGGFSYRRRQFDEDGKRYPVFEIPVNGINDYVFGQIKKLLEDPEIFIEHFFSNDFDDPTRVTRIETELAQARNAREELRLAEGRLYSSYERGIISEETLAERLSLQGEKATQLEQTIADLEIQLNTLTNSKLEVQKLREASKQVQYNLDRLSPQGKHILCDIFIDRIELNRKELPKTEGRTKKLWDIRAEIFYKFNLDKLRELQARGRTQSNLENVEKSPKKGKDGRSGGT